MVPGPTTSHDAVDDELPEDHAIVSTEILHSCRLAPPCQVGPTAGQHSQTAVDVTKALRFAGGALHRLRVRNALNPKLWLCVTATPIRLYGAHLFRDVELIRNSSVFVGLVPIVVTCLGFSYFVTTARCARVRSSRSAPFGRCRVQAPAAGTERPPAATRAFQEQGIHRRGCAARYRPSPDSAAVHRNR